MVTNTTKENVNLKINQQVQKDLVIAVNLKMEIEKEKQPLNIQNEEGPLPEEQSQCKKYTYKIKNRVLMQEHKDQTHKENKGQKCHMCGYFSHDRGI